MKDDRLRLIFTCCHPALAPSVAGRAHAATARRARDPRDRPRVPRAGGDDGASASSAPSARSATPRSRTASRPTPSCPTGCGPCSPSSTSSSTRATPRPTGDDLVRADLCAEAIRLARLLVELMPDEPEVLGLLALLLLTESRRAARTAPDGSMVLLPDQDRARWDRDLIAEGQALVRRVPAAQPAGPVPDPGRDQRRAQRRGDGGRHRLAPDPPALRPARSPSRRRRSSPSTARSRSPSSTARRRPSTAIDGLDLDSYHLFHVTRGDLLVRLGRADEAAAAYDRAIALTTNAAERRFPRRAPRRCRRSRRPAHVNGHAPGWSRFTRETPNHGGCQPTMNAKPR